MSELDVCIPLPRTGERVNTPELYYSDTELPPDKAASYLGVTRRRLNALVTEGKIHLLPNGFVSRFALDSLMRSSL